MKDLTSKPILIFLAAALLLQKSVIAQSYFTISTEPTPALFKQDDSKLFNGRNGEFVVVWRDFRNGTESYFGQLFDQQGNLEGSNFPVISNEAFAFGADGAFAS